MNIDVSKAVEISKRHPKAAEIFKALSERERPRERSDLGRLRREMLKEGYVISTREFMDVMKALEKAGYGKIILGQGQNPPRFDWKVNYIELGRETMEHGPFTRVAEHHQSPVLPSAGDKIVFFHDIRPGWPLKLVLPANITRAEAGALAEKIKLLAE